MNASIRWRPDDLCVPNLVVLTHVLPSEVSDRAPAQGPRF
jgi:hypothetical protein